MTTYSVPAYIAIGSNLDTPAQQVGTALERVALIEGCRLVSRSRLYRSAPLGPQDQPQFVNAAAGLLCRISARDLLTALQGIEKSMGREVPAVRWGPRRIDLDLLVYGAERIDEPDLVVPHPGVPVRNFVLYPLLDIAPDLPVPGHGRVRDLARRAGAAGLVPLP
ncbi:MAG TPA: 2-amino-4-hydroxy-6-hydroxymethyldihydropteridine diphosphokinase [Steroidobacteraceae bacterium]